MLRGREDEEAASKSTVRVFSTAAGGCKMQKQKKTSRLKKTCMNASEKACVAGLSHPCDSEPAMPVRALLLSLFLLSALFLEDKTADC